MNLSFLSSDWLLESKAARDLYFGYAQDAPVVDFHNHLSVEDILSDRRFGDICSLWVAEDRYKHRAMRIAGMDESLITGDAPAHDKFVAWCSLLPRLMGNPLFHWSCLEMKRVFGIEELPCAENAEELWEHCNSLLGSEKFSNNSILRSFSTEILTTSDDILDDVSLHGKASAVSGIKVSPSLRADSALAFGKPSFKAFLERLGEGSPVSDIDSYCSLLLERISFFAANGCRLSDHALDSGFRFVKTTRDEAARIFEATLGGPAVSDADYVALKSYVLEFLACEYARRGWVMQLHIGAERFTSSRLREVSGAAGGYACPGNSLDLRSLCDFLDALDLQDCLPRTILYTLNPSDNAILSSLTGSFALSGCQKIQFGPAWWYNDHLCGITDNLDALSSYSVLFNSIGMTTDSRSILSFSRHEYFRRILCNYLGSMIEKGLLPRDIEFIGEAVRDISYRNSKRWIYNEQ